MGYCKKIKMDCLYTNRDNDNNCSLDKCKYILDIDYNNNFTVTPKSEPTKTKKKRGKKNEEK